MYRFSYWYATGYVKFARPRTHIPVKKPPGRVLPGVMCAFLNISLSHPPRLQVFGNIRATEKTNHPQNLNNKEGQAADFNFALRVDLERKKSN